MLTHEVNSLVAERRAVSPEAIDSQSLIYSSFLISTVTPAQVHIRLNFLRLFFLPVLFLALFGNLANMSHQRQPYSLSIFIMTHLHNNASPLFRIVHPVNNNVFCSNDQVEKLSAYSLPLSNIKVCNCWLEGAMAWCNRCSSVHHPGWCKDKVMCMWFDLQLFVQYFNAHNTYMRTSRATCWRTCPFFCFDVDAISIFMVYAF